MATYCGVCSSKITYGKNYCRVLSDKHVVCRQCAMLYGDNKPPTLPELQQAWARNNEKAPHFHPTDKFDLANDVTAYLDRERKWFYLYLTSWPYRPMLFECKDILSIQIEDNGRMVTVSSGSMGGAIIGGILAGPVGAIAGQHAGTTYTRKEEGPKTTVIQVTNELGPQEIKIYKSRPAAVAAFQRACAELLEPAQPEQPQQLPAASPADEIMKYKSLLDMGAITEEEFAAAKKKILDL